VLGRPVSFGEVAAVLRPAFEGVWGIELREGGLSAREREVAESLATRYLIEA
jgi:hypothetical protein